MTISRRDFLSSVGAGAASLPFARMPSFGGMTDNALHFSRGRVLTPIMLADGGLLLPDTIIPLIGGTSAHAVLTRFGALSAESIQPLHDIDQVSFDSFPAPVVVVSPAAPVLSHCADEAPLAGLPGYGTPLMALSSLSVAGDRWLELADGDGQLLGWSRATGWTGWAVHQGASISRIVIHRTAMTLSVGQGDALTELCALGMLRLLAPGQYPLRRMSFAQTQPAFTPHNVVPFMFQADGLSLSGAYWHNAFGRAELPVTGVADVHVPMWAAQWLYENIRLDAIIEVV